MSTSSVAKSQKLILAGIIFSGILIRIYFFIGHIYSDDSYYSKLSDIFINNSDLSEYQGYPIFILRKIFIWMIAFSYKIFGMNEISSVIIPFILSIASLFLINFYSKILFEDFKTRAIAVFLLAFFPLEVVFASIAFPDLTNVFFINFGLLILYYSIDRQKYSQSVIAGLIFSLSFLIKEYFIYTIIFLLVILIYSYFIRKVILKQIIISLFVFLTFLIIESLYYKITRYNFFYRFSVLQQNYQYCWYDFFPYNVKELTNSDSYITNLAYHFLLSFKFLFLRRFYLFIPLISLVLVILNFIKRRFVLLSTWFAITLFALIFLPTSLDGYKPLNLERSWYIFPLIFPAILLVSERFSKLKGFITVIFLFVYFIAGIIMSGEYSKYFQVDSNREFKNYLHTLDNKLIYTDHFTLYGIELISGKTIKAINISNNNSLERNNLTGAYLLYNKRHLDELKLQGYKFPILVKINFDQIKPVKTIGDFQFYFFNH